MAPLDDIFILDFSTLLPGPMATLLLADAGATVVKIERPGGGDDMRGYDPVVGGTGVNFSMLNRAKRSVAIDLKASDARERLLPLLRKADVIIEQFRPGVMARLGLGYDAVREINPDIVYCSITGWGQSGPKAEAAGHDLNYMAETGVLGLSVGADGSPILPPALVADIAGGTYPAVINILLALRQRDRTGKGTWIDVAMGENLFPFLYWALGNAKALDRWPVPGGETVTGGTPRYQIYRTKDDRFLAAAPLEEKFWASFVKAIALPGHLHDDRRDPHATRMAVADIIAKHTAEEWSQAFDGIDVCCSIVLRLDEALKDGHWRERGLFDRQLTLADRTVPALPSILAPGLRSRQDVAPSPVLGEGNGLLV